MVSQVLELRGVTRVLRSSLAELKRERSAHEFWALAQPGALEPRLPRLASPKPNPNPSPNPGPNPNRNRNPNPNPNPDPDPNPN